MIGSNNTGACPYCNSGDVTPEVTQNDPRRTIKKCNACDKFSALNNATGKTHPLVDPMDKTSSPGKVVK